MWVDDNGTEYFCCTPRMFRSTIDINSLTLVRCTTCFLRCTGDERTITLIYKALLYGAYFSQCSLPKVLYSNKLYGLIPVPYVKRADSNYIVYFSLKQFSYLTVPLGFSVVLYDETAALRTERVRSIATVHTFLVHLRSNTMRPHTFGIQL